MEDFEFRNKALNDVEQEIEQRLRPVEFSDFAGVAFISYADPAKGDLYKEYLAPAGIEPAKQILAEHPEAAIELTKSGFGITLIPKWAVESHLSSKALLARSLTPSGIYFEWKAVRLKDRPAPRYQQEFVKLMIAKKVAIPRDE